MGGSRFSMLFYVVPVAPGASRFLAAYSTDALPPGLRAAVAGGEPLAGRAGGSLLAGWEALAAS